MHAISSFSRFNEISAAVLCMDPEHGTGDLDPPPENHKAIWFLSNTGPDPLKNHKATRLALNVGSSSAGQRKMVFLLQVEDGRHIMVFGSSLPSSNKKTCQSWTPL